MFNIPLPIYQKEVNVIFYTPLWTLKCWKHPFLRLTNLLLNSLIFNNLLILNKSSRVKK